MNSTGTKRALLIGINYLQNPAARLNGCIEDVNNIRGLMIDAYGYSSQNIIMLRDDNGSFMPTKRNIINALQNIIASSGVNDETWFHYSGHGTQVRDLNTDEMDGADEVIVPVDYTTAGIITDDDLFNLVRNIRGRAFLTFDSCHSGSVCDLQYSINYVNGAFSKSITSIKAIPNPNIVVLSGSRDAQTSMDSYDNSVNKFGGALTISFIEAIRKNRHNVDILKVYNDLCYILVSAKYEQIPVLSSSSANPVLRFVRPASLVAPIFIPPILKPATVVKNTNAIKSIGSNENITTYIKPKRKSTVGMRMQFMNAY
jgi:hypothetical protein